MFNDDNFRTKQSQSDKNIQLEKRKKLLAKFSGLKIDYQTSDTSHKPKPKNDIKSVKEISNLKQLIIQLRKELKDTKELNNQLKDIIFNLNKENKNQVNLYNALLSQYNSKLQLVIDLETELNNIKEQTSPNILSKLSVSNAELKTENQQLKLRCNHFLNEINIIKKGHYLNYYITKISELKSEIENYKYQISIFEKKIDDINMEALKNQTELQEEIEYLRTIIENINSEFQMPVDELLVALEINLTYDNIRQYDHIYKILWKINKLKHENGINKKTKVRLGIIPLKSIYGYLIKRDDVFYFSSIQGEIYFIDSCRIKLRRKFVEDMPCLASINRENYARLEQMYDDMNLVVNKFNKERVEFVKKHLNKMNEELDKFTFNYNFKILIVGVKNKDECISKLESHGLEVIWHNTFEEHENVLRGKFSSADVVIICTKHVEHASLSAINKYDEKVELMERESANAIFHRVRYALIRLGLITIGDKENDVAATTLSKDKLV